MNEQAGLKLRFHPVTVERLPDLERFSREHGKFRYCSCMRWRMTSSDFRRSTKEERAAALTKLVIRGVPVGVLAFSGGKPVGWCSAAPRDTYTALETYRPLLLDKEAGVWSVVCFFIDSRFRRRGMTSGLLNAAVKYARSEGARSIEGFPVEPVSRSYTYMGSPSAFVKAGFRDETPAEQARTVMRYDFN